MSIPILPEQRRIVSFLDEFHAKVDTLRGSCRGRTGAEMDALTLELLDKAFNGSYKKGVI